MIMLIEYVCIISKKTNTFIVSDHLSITENSDGQEPNIKKDPVEHHTMKDPVEHHTMKSHVEHHTMKGPVEHHTYDVQGSCS